MFKVILLEGCPSRGMGLLRKTAVSGAMSGLRAEDTCCCSYCCMSAENVYLPRTAKTQLYHKRDINMS